MKVGATEVDAVDVALLVAAAIERVGGAYFVGGSVASSLQGEPRSTNDVDIVLELPLGRIGEFVEALGSDFEVDVDMLRRALLAGSSCNIFFLPTVTKVDLFGLGGAPYDEAEFSRKRPVVVREPDVRLVVKSPEDTALRKLWWFRQGGEVSERQWRDVVQVLKFNAASLEGSYMDTSHGNRDSLRAPPGVRELRAECAPPVSSLPVSALPIFQNPMSAAMMIDSRADPSETCSSKTSAASVPLTSKRRPRAVVCMGMNRTASSMASRRTRAVIAANPR